MATKRLTRSLNDRVIAGVCGGLGEYFDIDPVVFRILAVFIFFWGGGGLLLYIILWLVIPEEGNPTTTV
jgi:phage shock protein PspC (stress-responsive transcriptional regulator)